MALNRRKVFLTIGIFILGGIIGGIIGASIEAYRTSHFFSSFVDFGSHVSRIVTIKEKIFILRTLREGITEKAIEQLEVSLDHDLMYYSEGFHGSEKIDKNIRQTLKAAKDYRMQFPRTTSQPETDKAVAKALAEADK